ncbi:tumor necrosis factor ligand superfamily member 13B-like [Kryptolebias marmoratus]|uniref:tumor necrosis factor ligand superfamily member 13B-like n=1 Tax=Kryptolebias marmoratus TaxID=37003 RepID=UPI000D52F3A3|nr:tumor necrosis factor ligand superfamily member 13B-like [Kryptolebias marmoratus]
MLLNTFLSSLLVLVFCSSLLLLHRVGVLEGDFQKLQGDIVLQLNRQLSEGGDGKTARLSQTGEDVEPSAFQRAPSSLKASSRRVKREPSSCRAPISFLQLKANTNKQPERRGNITVIPWTVSVQRGNIISQRENRVVVQEDGYYLVFGQVLFESQSEVMGHVIQSWSSTEAGRSSAELLRCLQDMPDGAHGSTCYTTGTVRLLQGDELELVVLYRPSALISMEPDATFFGVIHLS